MKQASENPSPKPVTSTMMLFGVISPVSPGSVSLMAEAAGRFRSIRKYATAAVTNPRINIGSRPCFAVIPPTNPNKIPPIVRTNSYHMYYRPFENSCLPTTSPRPKSMPPATARAFLFSPKSTVNPTQVVCRLFQII